MIVDLNFVAIMHGHPLFAWLDGNPYEDTGVIIFIAHFEDNMNHAISDFAARPIQKAHSAVRVDQAVFHGIASGTHVFPSRKILSVEDLLPLARVSFTRIFVGTERQRCETGDHKDADTESF